MEKSDASVAHTIGASLGTMFVAMLLAVFSGVLAALAVAAYAICLRHMI